MSKELTPSQYQVLPEEEKKKYKEVWQYWHPFNQRYYDKPIKIMPFFESYDEYESRSLNEGNIKTQRVYRLIEPNENQPADINVGQSEVKSETVEEAAENIYPPNIIPHYPIGGGSPEPFDTNNEPREAFINGANWQKQQFQDKLKEVAIKAAEYGYNYRSTTQFPDISFDENCKNNLLQWLSNIL